LGVFAHFRERMCRGHMRQNVGKVFFTGVACFRVMNFIPVGVSTLYNKRFLSLTNGLQLISKTCSKFTETY
jgi:hypothetical protein